MANKLRKLSVLKKKDRLYIVWSATNYAMGQTETYTWHEVLSQAALIQTPYKDRAKY